MRPFKIPEIFELWKSLL